MCTGALDTHGAWISILNIYTLKCVYMSCTCYNHNIIINKEECTE